ncbi:hypothetical protein FACS1894188_12490 [Clostridia bacterium]|nr:hypothetical protein FACS1894188_12490 [Clostridia bacterium]
MVDAAQEAAVCKYCDSAYIVKDAITNYNIAHAQITAQTVNINVGGGDFVIEDGRLKKYRGNDSDIIVPNSAVFIEHGAFNGCLTIKSVVITNSVKTIGGDVFRGCVNLRSVTFLGDVECPFHGFSGCSLMEIKTNGDVRVNGIPEKFSVTVSILGHSIVFPQDLSYRTYNKFSDTGAKDMANLCLMFLRGYNRQDTKYATIDGLKPKANGKSFGESPIYINGENVIDRKKLF